MPEKKWEMAAAEVTYDSTTHFASECLNVLKENLL